MAFGPRLGAGLLADRRGRTIANAAPSGQPGRLADRCRQSPQTRLV
jgi:hypothetical protein